MPSKSELEEITWCDARRRLTIPGIRARFSSTSNRLRKDYLIDFDDNCGRKSL